MIFFMNEKFRSFIRDTYKDHKYISAKMLVSEFLLTENVKLYRPTAEVVTLRRKLTYDASSVIKDLVKDRKIKKYNTKQYRVL